MFTRRNGGWGWDRQGGLLWLWRVGTGPIPHVATDLTTKMLYLWGRVRVVAWSPASIAVGDYPVPRPTPTSLPSQSWRNSWLSIGPQPRVLPYPNINQWQAQWSHTPRCFWQGYCPWRYSWDCRRWILWLIRGVLMALLRPKCTTLIERFRKESKDRIMCPILESTALWSRSDRALRLLREMRPPCRRNLVSSWCLWGRFGGEW